MMLEGLTERLDGVVKRLRGLNKLTEENVAEAMREVRMALLEADVNISVVKEFIAGVRKEALGAQTMPGLTPGQHLVKIVHDKIVELLGGQQAPLAFAERGITKILVTGLQGSGKTTTTAKLARHIAKMGYRPMVASADIYRPAAIEQLKILARELEIPYFDSNPSMAPVDIVKRSMEFAAKENANVLLIDTAGRLHIDDDMMAELEAVKNLVSPTEILFVADSMTGQDAVTVAKAFNERIGMSGVVLTKLDGDTRGGAALSIKKVTGAPIKFVGVGEKTDQFEPFHPERLAGRILGMGDVMSLIERVQENIDQKQAEQQAAKMLSASFTLTDFLDQIRMVKKMGPLEQLLKMLPGVGGAMKDMNLDPRELTKVEAIICSMTRKERETPHIINMSRKLRIALGSGMEVTDVNRLLKNFDKSKKMMKTLSRFKGKKSMANPFAGLGM
ncbi:MAG: signal recognition particle protein [Nitrospinae bacterium]|nr:signal recognition particle protein [Nitrospinota bacterium]